MIAYFEGDADPIEACGRGRAVLARAVAGELCLAASVVRGATVVLGARQRLAAVSTATRAVRRASTGTELFLGDVALWWSLGLPRIDALFPDAMGATLLNRNVRGFLRGFTARGVMTSYLGREFLAVRGAVGAVLGYDVAEDGAVLLEVIAGWSHPPDLPVTQRATTASPRAAGVALGALVPQDTPQAFLRAVSEAVASRSGRSLRAAGALAPAADPGGEEPAVRSAVRVPIGVVEAGEVRGAPWFGGDALVSTAWLRRAEAAAAQGEPLPDDAVLHGARPADYLRAWRGDALSP
ncbi:MAG: hypothetical protein U0325_03815 [Polyangiales bacterium]